MTNKIMRANGMDPDAHPVPIVIYSDMVSAAKYFPANPPFIGVNAATLQNVETVDKLAQSIAHELTHFEIRQYTGTGSKNSKLEEISAESRGLWMIAEAGYNPQNVIHSMKFGAIVGYQSQSQFSHIMEDDHASTAMDLRAMENTLAYYKRDRGIDYTVSANPLPVDILSHAVKLPQVSTAPGAFNYIKFEREYAESTTLQKLEIIANNINETDKFKDIQLIEKLSRIRIDPKNINETKAFQTLADTILDHTSTPHQKLYGAATYSWLRSHQASDWKILSLLGYGSQHLVSEGMPRDNNGQSPSVQYPQLFPLGRAEDLRVVIDGFIHARTSTEAITYAEKISTLTKKNRFYFPC